MGIGLVFSPFTYCLQVSRLGMLGGRTYHDDRIIYATNVLVCIRYREVFDKKVFGRIRPIWLVGHHLQHVQYVK